MDITKWWTFNTPNCKPLNLVTHKTACFLSRHQILIIDTAHKKKEKKKWGKGRRRSINHFVQGLVRLLSILSPVFSPPSIKKPLRSIWSTVYWILVRKGASRWCLLTVNLLYHVLLWSSWNLNLLTWLFFFQLLELKFISWHRALEISIFSPSRKEANGGKARREKCSKWALKLLRLWPWPWHANKIQNLYPPPSTALPWQWLTGNQHAFSYTFSLFFCWVHCQVFEHSMSIFVFLPYLNRQLRLGMLPRSCHNINYEEGENSSPSPSPSGLLRMAINLSMQT